MSFFFVKITENVSKSNIEILFHNIIKVLPNISNKCQRSIQQVPYHMMYWTRTPVRIKDQCYVDLFFLIGYGGGAWVSIDK